MIQLHKIHIRLIRFYWFAIAVQVFFIGWHLFLSKSYIMPFFHLGFLIYFNEQRKKRKKENLILQKKIEELEKLRKQTQL